ncbi:MAG: peptide chain release factor N(5)-glutamine methyltransferase [Rhodanobacter sp.]
MATIRECLQAAKARLVDRIDADLLLEHLSARSRSWLVAHADDVMQADDEAVFAALVRRRLAGEPIAYILGRRGFWSLDLEVTADTLIPRVETELLVELALLHLPAGGAMRVADLGTGSGAVALALAQERPHAHVIATDLSAGALAVARRNVQRLGLRNIALVRGDWLEPLLAHRFDLIVANPPYIEAGDPHLRHGDLRFEPLTALASGGDGLDAIRRIVTAAWDRLAPGGWLLFEHGAGQGDAASALLVEAGYVEVATAQDLEHRDRVSGGRTPA